jgi:hypothetical protein
MKADKYIPNPSVEVPKVKNYSQARKVALREIGPDARVWKGESGKEPAWMVGRDMKPGRLVLGFSDTLQEALEKAVAAHKAG